MAEENIIVVDVGSSSVKAGFSGEDIPSYVFPSITALPPARSIESIEGWSGDSNILASQFTSGPVHPVHRGLVKDWEAMEQLWHNLIKVANLSMLDNSSILVIESVQSSATDRAHWAEMLFEAFHVPSICIANSASLSVFASGRTTGVAVECGAGLTTAVPVFEGLVLRHAVSVMDYGGQDVSFNLKRLFNDKNIQVDLASAKIIKEQLAYINGFQSRSLEQTTKEKFSFSLPDGNEVTVDTKLLRDCTEPLITNNNTKLNPGNNNGNGLINQVQESIILCDESIKRDLTQNIIISGGTSLLPGLGDRLHHDLMNSFNANPDPRINSLAPIVRVVPTTHYREPGYTSQRKFAPWIGGSLLSSFETYHKTLKITRQEWEENPDVFLTIKNI